MKLWHKLRKGAYFVDVMLLIAALFAIIGLATFVRLHTSNAPDEASRKGTIGIDAQHLDTLSLEGGGNTSGPPGTDTSGQTVGPADPSTSSRLQSTAPAPESSSPTSICATDCDDTVITTPKIKTPFVPITIEPIRVPIKPCEGLIKRALNSVLKTDPNEINCPT